MIRVEQLPEDRFLAYCHGAKSSGRSTCVFTAIASAIHTKLCQYRRDRQRKELNSYVPRSDKTDDEPLRFSPLAERTRWGRDQRLWWENWMETK